MKKMNPKLEEKIVEESRELVFLTAFLTLFLTSLMIYRELILNQSTPNIFHFGYNFLEALLLAKIILLGEMFHLGERFNNKSLIFPSVYMAMVFSLFVFIFSILEHFIFGLFEGKEMHAVWNEFTSHGLYQNIGKLLITFLVFILLFSFMQITRIFGEEKIFKLFFHRDKE